MLVDTGTTKEPVICGGLSTDGSHLSSPSRLTRPSEDYYNPVSCGEEIDGDEGRCFEDCILKNFAKPNKPRYGIGPQGTDCQEYADNLWRGCKMLCIWRDEK